MPYEFSLETSSTIQIGTRTIPLAGQILENNSTFKLVYQARSLDEAIELGSIADAFNGMMDLSSEALEGLKSALVTLQDQLRIIAGKLPADAANIAGSPLALLRKLNDVLKDLHVVDNRYTGGTDVTTYITDVVAIVSIDKKEIIQLMLGLAFEFNDARIFNIQMKSAGIRFTVLNKPPSS